MFLLVTTLLACSDYGYHEYEAVDVYQQHAAEKVDVLLVIDDSTSMAHFQELLGANLPAFLSFFLDYDIDYKIGVITTDVFSETAGVISGQTITPETPDADAAFSTTCNVGTSGSGAEMGLHAAWLALADPVVAPKNDGFLRDGSYLSVVWLSDEDDTSPWSVDTYLRDYRATKPDDRSAVNASALVVTDKESCSEDLVSESAEGLRYIDAAHRMSGVAVSLCDENFESIVSDVSLSISRLEDTFYLSDLPDAGTLEVQVDDEVIPCDDGRWTYQKLSVEARETGAVVFDPHAMPPVGVKIAVRYNIGSGSPDAFCAEGSR